MIVEMHVDPGLLAIAVALTGLDRLALGRQMVVVIGMHDAKTDALTRRPVPGETAEGVGALGLIDGYVDVVGAIRVALARDAEIGIEQRRVEDPARCSDVIAKELRVVVADALTAETRGLARIAGQTAVDRKSNRM